MQSAGAELHHSGHQDSTEMNLTGGQPHLEEANKSSKDAKPPKRDLGGRRIPQSASKSSVERRPTMAPIAQPGPVTSRNNTADQVYKKRKKLMKNNGKAARGPGDVNKICDERYRSLSRNDTAMSTKILRSFKDEIEAHSGAAEFHGNRTRSYTGAVDTAPGNQIQKLDSLWDFQPAIAFSRGSSLSPSYCAFAGSESTSICWNSTFPSCTSSRDKPCSTSPAGIHNPARIWGCLPQSFGDELPAVQTAQSIVPQQRLKV
eukprot:IDg11385t1